MSSAAAVIIAAATTVAAPIAAATAAEQDDQDNNDPEATAAPATAIVIAPHEKEHLQFNLSPAVLLFRRLKLSYAIGGKRCCINKLSNKSVYSAVSIKVIQLLKR